MALAIAATVILVAVVIIMAKIYSNVKFLRKPVHVLSRPGDVIVETEEREGAGFGDAMDESGKSAETLWQICTADPRFRRFWRF